MAALSELPALTFTYCTRGDIEAVLAIDGLDLRLDDEQTGTVSEVEEGYLNRIIAWASSRVNLYLMGRYNAAMLAVSYVVNDFTATIAAHRLSRRRGNPAPESIAEAYKETIELMTAIKANQMSLEDVPERTSGSISWRNIHHSRHTLRRNRVQKPISERTRSDGQPMATDLLADYVGPEIYWLG